MSLEDLKTNLPNLHAAHLETKELQAQEKKNEWLALRLGKFTASEFYKLMSYENKETFPVGAESYVLEKVLEVLTVKSGQGFTSSAIDWGNQYEEEAAERFMTFSGKKVYNYGSTQQFVVKNENVGCTPDGLIGTKSGLETKCPNSKTHLSYLNINTQEEFKKECKNYYWQIQGSMYVCNRNSWYFVSYDPRFKNKKHQLKVLKINRDEVDVKKLKWRLETAIEKRDKYLKEYAV